MILASGDRIKVTGDVTMETASKLFHEGLPYSGNNSLVIDFSQLGKVDSSAVSLMLVWMREAKRNKVSVRFESVPANLVSLADLYGVAELLPLNTAE